jgi:hypothetical protein
MLEDFKKFMKENGKTILIVIGIIVLLFVVFFIFGTVASASASGSKKESYIGNPLSKLRGWDSGGLLRSSVPVFSATNQGSAYRENMTGSNAGPSYMMSPYTQSYDAYAHDPDRVSTAEGFANPKMNINDYALASKLRT